MAVAAMLAIVDGDGVIVRGVDAGLELSFRRLVFKIDADVLIVRLMELMRIRHGNDRLQCNQHGQ